MLNAEWRSQPPYSAFSIQHSAFLPQRSSRMSIPLLTLPRPVPPERLREAQDDIPPTRAERERVRLLCRAYVDAVKPVPPLSFEELRRHSGTFVARHGIDAKFLDFVAVVLNSEVWRD